MPTPSFQPPEGVTSGPDMVDYIYRLIRDLNYLMGNLDDLNISRLNAKVIIAGSITALQIAANTITADKMDVSELSAITANLGTIIAGVINAVTINGATINIQDDVSIGRYLYMNASSPSGVEKGISFKDAGTQVGSIKSLSGDLGINASGFLTLTGGAGVYANGGLVATQGISVAIDVMGGDGITPMTLTFSGGVLQSVV